MTPQEIEALKAERDALAAQVEALKYYIIKYQELGAEFILNEALLKTPQQCLRDVKAEAILNFVMFVPRFAYNVNSEIEKFANEYAATVRQGGAE